VNIYIFLPTLCSD